MENIGSYCNNCKLAYDIGSMLFNKSTSRLNSPDYMHHNIMISVEHRTVPTPVQSNSRHRRYEMCFMEHTLTVFGIRSGGVHTHTRIRILLPTVPHQEECPTASIEARVHTYKVAHETIKRNIAKTIHELAMLAYHVSNEGISTVHQAARLDQLETIVMIMLGNTGDQAPEIPGFDRKRILLHGKPTTLGGEPGEAIGDEIAETAQIIGELNLGEDVHCAKRYSPKSSKLRPAQALRQRMPGIAETRLRVPIRSRDGASDDQILIHRSIQRDEPHRPRIPNPSVELWRTQAQQERSRNATDDHWHSGRDGQNTHTALRASGDEAAPGYGGKHRPCKQKT